MGTIGNVVAYINIVEIPSGQGPCAQKGRFGRVFGKAVGGNSIEDCIRTGEVQAAVGFVDEQVVGTGKMDVVLKNQGCRVRQLAQVSAQNVVAADTQVIEKNRILVSTKDA